MKLADLNFQLTDSVSQANMEAIERGISQSTPKIEPRNQKPLNILVRNKEEELIAGLSCSTYWGWLHIRLLWVDSSAREFGLGSKLILRAEEEAKSRGCMKALVDTFSFQAPNFYKKLGYQEFASLEDFPPGQSRIYFWKRLAL